MIPNTIKITSTGQITLPREIRNLLKTDIISFEIDVNDKIIINPTYSVAGSLREYAKNNIKFDEARNIAWKKLSDDWKE